MTLFERRIPDGTATPGEDRPDLMVTARYDRRLRKSIRWTVHHNTVEIRIPPRIRQREVAGIVDEIVNKILKQRTRARKQQDFDLQARAEEINRLYFGGDLQWHTIRWVSNMQKRLGSCTYGGATDGDIRISDRIKPWPRYVVDYVIAHELAHRQHPDHSPAFWAYLAQYPKAERARGFIEGVAFAQDMEADELL